MTYVYWIHLSEHTDITTEGYIGISERPQKRLNEHKRNKTNEHLTNAFEKYKDIVHTILVVGDREYCLEVEKKLRPTKNIGWNISEGGGDPPSHKGKAKSDEWKSKVSKTKTGVPRPYFTGENNPNYGKGAAKGTKWFYDPITKVSKYFIPGQQPDGWLAGRYSRTKVKN